MEVRSYLVESLEDFLSFLELVFEDKEGVSS